jgi:hypothetical protein
VLCRRPLNHPICLPRYYKRIDTKLSTVPFNLLGQPEGEPTSLATRNLLRNLTMEVPSGQRVAQAMQLPELAAADLDDLQPFQLHKRIPLWFYVLREPEVTAGGEQLGPVGGRIVAEVIIGLVRGATGSPTCARIPTGPQPTGPPARSRWLTCSVPPALWRPSHELPDLTRPTTTPTAGLAATWSSRLARTLMASTLAHDQPIRPANPSRSSTSARS